MHARVTQLEIDTTRIDMDHAVQLFRAEVLPALREQEGYDGTYVLANPDGKALLLTFWETQEAAEAQRDDRLLRRAARALRGDLPRAAGA